MEILIKNARLRNVNRLVNIQISEGKITSISGNCKEKAEIEIDAGGRLVLPSFSDMHLHLDSVMTIGIPRYNDSGTLQEGITIWGEYKKKINKEEMKNRARLACEWNASHGTTRIRTHADITESTLSALKGLLELKQEIKSLIDLEVTAFPQDGIMTDKQNQELLEKALELGADNVGIIPHQEFTREDGIKSIEFAFELAKKYSKNIDGHVDETDDENSKFLEVLAANTIRNHYEGRVTAGHCTAMHSYNNAYAAKLFSLLKQANITVVPNPPINIHLQGRFDTYPKRRGMARVKELIQCGINVALGNDCIMDPWYPLGRGDMLHSLYLCVHIAQLTGYYELINSLDLITINSAKALGIIGNYGIEVGKKADLVVVDAFNELETIRDQPARLFVIKAGRLVASTEKRNSHVLRSGKLDPLSFHVG
ncbi:MAG: cytosine deaminase [Candidatus Methanomethylicus sp.]|nr:cytosine deaminase [Candidatus Methanomethylicus sp.]